MNARATYTLEGFTRVHKIQGVVPTSFTFSSQPTATYKWGVFAPRGVGDAMAGMYTAQAWAKTRTQAVAFAVRHGLRRNGYVIGKRIGGDV